VIQYVQAERTSLSENAHPAQTHGWTKHSCIEYFWMLPLSEETSSIRHALSVEGSLRACFCSVPFCSFPTVAPPSAPTPRPDRRGPVARFEFKMLVLPTTTEKLPPFLFFCARKSGALLLCYIFSGGRQRPCWSRARKAPGDHRGVPTF